MTICDRLLTKLECVETVRIWNMVQIVSNIVRMQCKFDDVMYLH